jgi:putative membrane protein
MIPKWANHILDHDGAKKIAEAVKSVEASTIGEIVPMIVRRSSTVGHVFYSIVLAFFSLFLFLELFFYKQFLSFSYSYYWLTACYIIVFPIAYLFSQFMWVQRFFVSEKDELMQVMARAELEFYRQKINGANSRAGILLFVSLMEHKAVVLADISVSQKLPNETWDKIVQTLVLGIKNREAVSGFEKAISECGVILKEKLPANGSGTKKSNELSDLLIIKE